MSVRRCASRAALIGAVTVASSAASAQHHHHHHHGAAAQPTPDEAPAPAEATPAPVAAAPTPAPAPAPTVVSHAAPTHAAPTHAAPAAVVVTSTTTTASTAPVVASPGLARPVALDVAIGIRAVSRHLSFHQDLNAQFQPYDLWIAPAAALAIEWFPGAHFTRGFLAHIGVYAQGDYVFGVASQDHDGNTYTTAAYDYGGGLRIRIPLPLGGSEIGILGGYSGQVFINQPSAMTSANSYVALSTSYAALRGGLSLRLELTPRIAILASGGYLDVLSAGANVDAMFNVNTYFPRATVAAVDASVGVAVVLGAGFEARALLEARRYFYAMNPNLGDAYIVGGALDQYFTGAAFIAWRH